MEAIASKIYNHFWFFPLPLKCWLKAFGFSCPTCGLGRAIVAALKLRFLESIEFHPLGIPFVLVLVSGTLLFFFNREALIAVTESMRAFILKRRKLSLAVLIGYCIWGFTLREIQ